jgi:hypothetical protein
MAVIEAAMAAALPDDSVVSMEDGGGVRALQQWLAGMRAETQALTARLT